MGLFNLHIHSKEELQSIMVFTILLEKLGLTKSKAKVMAKKAMQKSITTAKKSGEYYVPSNLYDIAVNGVPASGILGKHLTKRIGGSDKMKDIFKEFEESLHELRNAGVAEEDIKNWWNQSAISRYMQIEYEIIKFLVAQEQLRITEPNLSEEEASMETAKRFPVYVSFNKYTSDIQNNKNDGILYSELIHRVQNYIDKRLKDDPDSFEKEIKSFSSMNALIRKKLSSGKLM